MSPNVGNFVHDLVEMAKAMETLPMREAEIRDLRITLDEAQSHNQGLEQNISNYKQQIEDLQSKVRSLEVERDDASFRVLETDEAIQKFLMVIRSAEQSFGEIADGYDPKGSLVEKYYQDRVNREGLFKPQPTLLQPQAVELSQDQSTINPTEAGKTSSNTSPTDWKQDQAETSRIPQGQSEITPTSSLDHGGATVGAGSDGQSATDPISVELTKPDAEGIKPLGPYFNKHYYDQPSYITLHEWLAGGGTEDNYHWRPSDSHGLSY